MIDTSAGTFGSVPVHSRDDRQNIGGLFKMKDERIYRGDIYLANLNPYKGSEQGGKRPVIVIQNDSGNRYSPTVIVTAVTSRFCKKRALPTHVPLDNAELEKNSLALLEQIRTIDKTRLIRKIGRVSDEKMKEIGEAIHVSLDLNDEDEQHTNIESG